MKLIRGFSLLEVVVSCLLLSLIFLGTGNALLSAWRDNQSAYEISVAAVQLNNIKERLVALGDRAGLGDQIAAWNQENKIVLPRGMGQVQGHYPNYTVSLRWGALPKMVNKNIVARSNV